MKRFVLRKNQRIRPSVETAGVNSLPCLVHVERVPMVNGYSSLLAW